jgi:hypothetical protein
LLYQINQLSVWCIATQHNLQTPRRYSGYSGYSTGYDDDPTASLRDGWNVVERWQAWPAEERNTTLAYGAGEATVTCFTTVSISLLV